MTDLSTVAAAAKQNPTMKDLVEAQLPAIERQLGGTMNSEAFVRAVLSEITKSPQLMQADPKTLLGGVMLAAQLRLEIGSGLGEFYLTPRKERGAQICLPIIGYQGLIKLALRSEFVMNVQAFLVRRGDQFSYGANAERGMFYDWVPQDFEETRDWIGVVATAKMRAGGTTWVYLTRTQVMDRRPSYWASTPWKTNEDEMVKKTAVRALAKYLPKSTDLGRALEADEAKVQTLRGLDEVEVTRIDDDEPETVVVNENAAADWNTAEVPE
ncbi:recombination protein RecT [Microbacterium hydrothermale]|uniref:recombinase RecT n=1 Tax=Microbacterium hydrothermale TaxID=857427 RepID=UPI00222804F8|nr:recombinase RecT [Microbacterium hydrothermale]MCW2165373.1 recombination protein RecT [Microbacterium hydrothermale]